MGDEFFHIVCFCAVRMGDCSVGGVLYTLTERERGVSLDSRVGFWGLCIYVGRGLGCCVTLCWIVLVCQCGRCWRCCVVGAVCVVLWWRE